MPGYKSMDIADFILKKLDNDLPRNLYYHCAQHTRDVYQAAVKIGEVMGINEDEMLLLETAALFHDAGFLVQL
ncbi:MAG: HD domain-containing protein [Sphingobacteriales bacterium]|nr:MAG: HD domain-containing protein [Sphingobacteriales bacterium]